MSLGKQTYFEKARSISQRTPCSKIVIDVSSVAKDMGLRHQKNEMLSGLARIIAGFEIAQARQRNGDRSKRDGVPSEVSRCRHQSYQRDGFDT